MIDLYTRMSYARVFPRILPGLAARTILEAREYLDFKYDLSCYARSELSQSLGVGHASEEIYYGYVICSLSRLRADVHHGICLDELSWSVS